MNVVLGVCGFLSCLIMANILLNKHIKTAEFFNEFYSFHKKINAEISFSQSTIKCLVDELNIDNDFNLAIKKYFDGFFQEPECEYINDTDKALVFNYFNALGVGDKNTQLKAVNAFEYEIKNKKDIYNENVKKYRLTYAKIGILFGIIVFIIFI